MPMLSKILVPVDFSSACNGAIQYAEALASHFRGELTLLHVVAPLPAADGFPEAAIYAGAAGYLQERIATKQAELQGYLSAELGHLSVKRLVAPGDPAAVIADFATAEPIDLIVMPTHGYGPFRRFLLGSVTAKVLHDTHCPVWTGPHLENAPGHDAIRFRRVACAVDLGLQSRDVICWAARFAGEFDAHLEIIHAMPDAVPRMGGFYFDPEWRIQVADAAREEIQHLQNDLDVPAEIHLRPGEAPAAVTQAATESGADLLVIGRGRAAGVLGRLRANAYAIVRESQCPVVAL